jgi:hypothetical protein
MCGLVYLVICVFDFLVMPIVYTSIYRRQDLAYIVELTEKLQAPAQAAGLASMISSREWKPITLQEGAFFHLAFGAILTGAAITRGITQSNMAKSGRDPWHLNNNDDNRFENNYHYHQQSVKYDYREPQNVQYRQFSNNSRIGNVTPSNTAPNNAKNSNIDNPDA